jgi:hypothetical protein
MTTRLNLVLMGDVKGEASPDLCIYAIFSFPHTCAAPVGLIHLGYMALKALLPIFFPLQRNLRG